MRRYLIAAIVAMIYIAGTSWVVQSSGERYRSRLRANRRSGSRSPIIAANPPIARETSIAKEEVLPSFSASSTPKPPPSPAPKNEVHPASSTTATASPSAHSGPIKAPALEQPRQQENALPASRLEKPRTEVNPEYAWADSLDLFHLNSQDERRLGAALHKLILISNSAMQNGECDQRVDQAARPLLELRQRKDIDYTFTILDSDTVNAFSTPGGYIYLSRGLLNFIGKDEDYALEFVIGHEIAHVDFKHALKCVSAANAAEKSQGLSTLPQFYLFISFGYPDKQVLEADAWVFKKMRVELDRSRHEALAFLRKFEDFAAKNHFQAGRQSPLQQPTIRPGEPLPSVLENHFRAETAAWKRLNEVKALSKQLSSPSERSPQ